MIGDLFFWCAVIAAPCMFWLLPATLRYPFLALGSLGILFAYDPLSGISLLFFGAALFKLLPMIARGDARAMRLLIAIISTLAAYIVFFKGAETFSAVLGESSSFAGVIVPLGASYYTFKMIHVAIDAYRRREFVTPAATYFTYLFLFTAFVAGPIQRLDLFADERVSHFSPDHILFGLNRTTIGLIKQFIILRWLDGRIESWSDISSITLDALSGAHPLSIWIVLIGSYLHAYLNLSAYTDIAIGTSRLFGIVIQENFNWPVFARNLPEFWRRWHMTLSGWCQNYIYVPVLGWLRNPYIALIASFQVMGLWHVFSSGRVAWGLFQAAGVAVFMLWSRYARRRKIEMTSYLRQGLAWVITQLFIASTWIFVIAETGNDPLLPFAILLRAASFGLLA